MDRFAHERADYITSGPRCSTGFHRAAEAAIAYLRSRTADHWIMFAAGLALGALLG